ncbi:acyl-CoA dehydrogenase family protein [Amycolatopsis sp. NPDC004378]
MPLREERLRAEVLRARLRHDLDTGLRRMTGEIEACSGGSVYWPAVRWLAETGWIGFTIPAVYGGVGLGHLERLISIEETSRVNAAAGNTLQSGSLGAAMIVDFGSTEQKLRWLPDFAAGRKLISIAMTEPQAGSNLRDIELTATRAEDGAWELSGRKWLIANGAIADYHGVIARTGPGTDGLTAFVVSAEREGVRPGVRHDTSGQHGFGLAEIVFDRVRVRDGDRIGEVGQGLEIAHQVSTGWGKPNLAAVALGLHQAMLDEAVEFATELRVVRGKPLAELESARVKIGAIRARVTICRTLLHEAAACLDHGLPADEALLLAKLTGVESVRESAADLVDLFGGRGVTAPWRPEQYWRDVLMVLAPAGTSDIHRKRLAEIALGDYLPSAEAPTEPAPAISERP